MVFKRFLNLLLVVVSCLLSFKVWAQTDEIMIWGPEFTFSNNEIGDLYEENHHWSKTRKSKYNSALAFAQNQLLDLIQKKCTECQIEAVLKTNGIFGNQYRVIYSDGYWIDISLDLGVIETQAKPATREQYEMLAQRFQNDIFDSAKEIGLFPDTFMSGGHIHVGFEYFKNQPILLRNFLVDFANHFELAEGILDLNTKNAPSLRAEGEDKIEKLKVLIAEFDRGELIFNKKKVTTAYQLAEAYFHLIQKKNRYYGLNLARYHAGDYATIEIRSIRTQANFDEYLQELKLFESRIKYLKELSDKGMLIAVENYVDESSKGIGQKKFKKLLVQKFHNYVVESGLEWGSYKKLIYMSELRRKKIIPMCRQLFN